jgi:hypothetical protein
MANTGSKISMKVVTVLISIPIGIATRSAVEKIWVAVGPDRSDEGKSGHERWSDAISWALLTGAAMGFADLVARKSAEELWHTVVGERPPVRTRPTASKRVRKATPSNTPSVAPPA